MSEKQYTDPIYDLDGKISVSKAIPFGLQHILAMFVANIAPILIVAGVVKMPVEQKCNDCFFGTQHRYRLYSDTGNF